MRHKNFSGFVVTCSQKIQNVWNAALICALNLQPLKEVNWSVLLCWPYSTGMDFTNHMHWDLDTSRIKFYKIRWILQSQPTAICFCNKKYSPTNLAISELNIGSLLLVISSLQEMVSARLLWNPCPRYSIPMDAFQLSVGHTTSAMKQKNKVCCDNIWMPFQKSGLWI